MISTGSSLKTLTSLNPLKSLKDKDNKVDVEVNIITIDNRTEPMGALTTLAVDNTKQTKLLN